MSDDYKTELAVILPSLDPDEKFKSVVDGLLVCGFRNIVIVDDGSCAERQVWFENAASHPECHVLHHGVNKGKGRALKTAFEYVLHELPEVKGVITIDGDGQHLAKDIIACGERLLELGDKVVLGCRDFDEPGVPPRSVAGNKTTSFFFRLLFRIRLGDTQTGLRAIPTQYLPTMCDIEGERFEYETNMLLMMKRLGIEWVEQSIETVYDPDDYSSHYNAVKDSWRIARIMLKFIFGKSSAVRYVISSALSWVVDNALYLLLFALLSAGSLAQAAVSAISHVTARVFSSAFNFCMNNFFVFKKRGDCRSALWKYYCVCIPQTAISVLAVSLLVDKLSITAPAVAVGVKILIEAVLFCLSYLIQKKWVFGKDKQNDPQ